MGQHRAVRRARVPALATVVSTLGALALAALAAASGPAAAASERAALTYSGAVTSSAPGGTSAIHITEGDSVVLAVGAAPTRASASLLGYSITVHMASFPSGASSVTLKGSETYTAHFDSPGSYAFSWIGSNKLGEIKPKSGERTSATIEVAAAPTPPSGSSEPPGQPSGTPDSPGSTGSAGGTPSGSGASTTLNPPIGFSGGPGSGPNAAQLPVSLPTFGGPGGLGAAGTAGAGGHQQDVSVGGVPVGGSGATDAVQDPANPEFVADPHSAAPPRALAVVSIGSLAAVAACYAYFYLGGRANPGGRTGRPKRVRLPL